MFCWQGWLPGTQIPPQRQNPGKKMLPTAKEMRDRDCLSCLDICRSMGCTEGDVWCDCGATLCHLGSILEAGRRQMLLPPLKRARRRIQGTTDWSAYTAPGMIKEQVALKVISRQNDGQGSDWEWTVRISGGQVVPGCPVFPFGMG